MKYIYKVENLSPVDNLGGENIEEYEKILNEYGEEGYELVEIIITKRHYFHYHIFKKQING